MAAPTINITFDKTALKIGDTADVTFTFSAAPVGFTAGDIAVTGGTLSGLAPTADPLVFNAVFTPTQGASGNASVSVAAGSYTDTLGEAGLGGSGPPVAFDTAAPSASISSSASTLRSGEAATITVTFSEAVTGFSLSDLSAVGGTLSSLTATANPHVYTVEFSPNAGQSGLLGTVSLAANAYTDAAGNNGAGATSAAITINTLGPAVSITTSQATLRAGESAGLTFTFSSAPSGFAIGDLVVSGGTVSGLTNEGGGVYTALFTPNSGVNAGVGAVSVTSGSYTDSFGNGGGGASVSPISFDTSRPTVTMALADSALGIGQSTEVTFTFSEAVSGFANSDLTIENGTLSAVSSSDGGVTWKATLTPAAGVTDTTNVLQLDLTGVADQAGNSGAGVASSPNYVVDAQRPTATIVMADSALKAGETTLVTFTFSEAVTGFTNADLTVPNGTLSTVSSSDGGITWIAVYTPNSGVDDQTNVIVLDNSGYTDMAGNAGVGSTNSANYTVRTVVPTATIVVADNMLGVDETSGVTITFSEAVTGLTADDFTVANGAISNVGSVDGGITWTATLTPDVNITDSSNVIMLDMSRVTNGIGNAGVGTTDSTNYAVDTARPTATIAVANAAIQAGQTSLVTISFSEAVTGFTVSDLSVANGALSNLSSADGGTIWTATLTPTAGVSDATNLIVLDTALVIDAAGNAGSGMAISNNYAVGYVPPPQQGGEGDVINLPSDGGAVAAGPGDDSVSGGAGADVIQGNTGDDTLVGGGGDDIVSGGRDNDFVHGNAGADSLFGDLGNDSVFGGQGDDFVQGGGGNDYVLGDLGRDTVLGGQGADTVFGGAGDDYVSGDLGDDVLVGGAGADLFNFNGGGGRDVVMDFSQAEGDRIRISPADAANFAALSAKFSADGGNTLITFDSHTIVLVGVAKSALSAADFVFG